MSKKLMEVFDTGRKRVAVLQNAFQVTETMKLNRVSEMTFRLPAMDDKTRFCAPRNYVRYNHGDLYRILDYTTTEENVSVAEFTCEHAISTLADQLLFKDHVLEGYDTRDVIRYILAGQGNWVLGVCEFNFQYDYSWTSENLLSALMSVATPFTDSYKFEFKTHVYPWRINLRRLDKTAKPAYYVFKKFNQIRITKTSKSTQVATRLYCQGYGEGVNQLGIERVHPKGLPYIQSPPPIVKKYGIVEAHFVDRSYEDAQSLYNAGVALLEKMQEPREEAEVDVADLEGVSSNSYMKADVGEIIYFPKDKYRTFITEVVRYHDQAGGIKLTIANTPDDLVKSLADIADRQRIEATYSQGATQIWASQLQDNASPSTPLVFKLWIPEATRVVNSVRVKIELQRFRYYGKTTASGGGGAHTSSGGGGGTVTSADGGGYTYPTRTVPISTYTSKPYLDGVAGHYAAPNTDYATPTIASLRHQHPFNHDHLFTTSVLIPSIIIPSHAHSVTRTAHTHPITLPDHRHDIEPGIFLASETPESASVKIGGKDAFSMEKAYTGDITHYLIDENGEIPRGRFVDITITPNINAYVIISVAPQGFVQSKGGGAY